SDRDWSSDVCSSDLSYDRRADPSTPCRLPGIIALVKQPATETLSQVFANAQLEARRRNQEFVGVEHLALALLDDDGSEAVRVLRQMNIESGYVRNALAHTLPTAEEEPLITGDLPVSPKAQRIITSAITA